ncbi:fimbria/pilus outer membrane usher protein [Pseudoalteromonas sp. SMS1]|uniref:fimbria/pilus outer membrane usher protein n=1 Tax=Pseudoalteromonas sp. SMS1 TaxID=2908894 RepID=UPI001F1F50D7|nr:fimbria/pilus outer membrane usher protein [Pseudoalteromonas sp. SMS1]MCF2857666.1 fimbria/pilus outer membrane usher protein [Pseudoalteromonas sp. SMS1]
MVKTGFCTWPAQLKYVTFSLLLLWACTSFAATFNMDFPVRLNTADVGQVSAATNGIEIATISAAEFKNNLHTVLSDDVNNWLASLGDAPITLEEFAKQGIVLQMQPQDLTIEMTLAEKAMATDSLTYGKQKHFDKPSGEAHWAMLSNFNLSHERSNNNHDYRSQLEWAMNANIGGSEGLNWRSSLFWEEGSTQTSDLYRGDIAIFYDQPETPQRFTLGDTEMNSTGHLAGAQLAGFSIESAYSRLQPQRRITPGNSQQFVLPRAANLEIYINDFLISRIRLKAGRYDLSDLPLTSGVNNIQVIATYPNGDTQEFYFTTHYNARLLAKGLSDYAFAIGHLSSIEQGRYEYDDELFVSGSYEYGVTNKLTLGINGAAHPSGHVVGTIATVNSVVGNLSLRYSQSKAYAAQSGNIYSIESEHSVFGHGNFGSPNLRLGYEVRQDFTNTPWQEFSTISSSKRAFADYSYFINDHLDFNVNASRDKGEDNYITDNAAIEFNLRYEDIRVRTGFSHTDSTDTRVISENQFFLNFTWNHYARNTDNRARAQYSSRDKVASASYAKTNNNFVNDYGYEVRTEKGRDFRQEQLEASYTGAFVRADISATNYTRDQQRADSSSSINLSTSLGIADGHFGMGATTTAPFAIITKHHTLSDSDVLVNVDRKGRAQTKPSEHIGALVEIGTGYTNSQLNIDVPDAPLGYDWGPGMYVLVGGATTGHHIQIGSELSYTVIGNLLDDQGMPIAMKRGRVIKLQEQTNIDNTAESIPIFTNRTGRFVVEGISVGNYAVEINEMTGQFSVTDAEQRFIRVGALQLTHSQSKGGDNK